MLGVSGVVGECLLADVTEQVFRQILFISNINLFVFKEVVVIVVKAVVIVVKLDETGRGWLLRFVPPSV